ncbi:MAG: NAD-dependent epimerase/dehydratase family protein [Verrucomicrobia bacterium]|nr:NAD-dependent epimerase/dehydratase family protein [Verrucomicrobiota bacterium]MBV9671476.1 NAD-dependent epimerase/dehydratase family protein [Verrucomicrobiota bacterium]
MKDAVDGSGINLRFQEEGRLEGAACAPKTYLVTGGTGFLGRALVAALKADGRVARVARRFPCSYGDTFVDCDLDAPVQAWREAADGCAGVFHLAWATVPRTANDNPLADLETNLAGTVRLFEAVHHLPNISVTFVSSGGTVYGKARTLPVAEDHPLQPMTAYGVSKAAAEHYALLYRRLWGVDIRIVRLSNPFGPGQDIKGQLGAASIFAARALEGKPIEVWGDGSAIRDYIYVDDAISGLLATMSASPDCFGSLDPVVNIGSGRGVSLQELISLLERLLDKPIKVVYKPARDFDVPANVLDITRARSLLGWSPKISLEGGLLRHVAYLQDKLFQDKSLAESAT